ncbi:hypothetical protein [Sphingomonas solaris]|uniref:Uncharacterized protein n=1 Tax=Alterirhizorhabdus solaris TaxID=2529389 RepID=A0A558QYT9_9SPHN|nr:hypothetical protein [Sphingomonas solaris]TVV72300.1 hypothetical protein FOY91_14850 [Sphingomonas solaris]
MTDKQPMQADGAGSKGKPDATQAPKPGSGESAGGAYANPHTGKGPKDGGFDGGQSEKDYHGPGQLGEKVDDTGGGQGG